MKKKYIGILVLFIGFIFALPMTITITQSLMTPEEITTYNQSIHLIPQKISIRQYYTLLIERSEYLQMFWKSLGIAFLIVIGNGFYCVFMGSLLAKAKIKGKNILVFLYILQMLMPYQMMMLPYYIQFKILHLLETNMGLVIPMWMSPFGVVVVTLLVSSVPDELIEAVRLETSSLRHVFLNAILPMCRGGITILIIFIFAEAWNMVEQSITIFSDLYKQPLCVLLAHMKYDSSIVFAACVIYMVPVMISYFFFQESLEEEIAEIKK